MERLIRPAIDGGVPYLNQDFFNILQGSNLLSYKSLLEAINDTNILGNNGIIVKGVKNLTPSGAINTSNFDFRNSMIYLDGDFLEPTPSLSQESNLEIDSSKFYLIKTQIEKKREKKVTGFRETVSVESYFDISLTTPVNQSFIEIEIKNNKNYCQRYLDRILRYYFTDFGQIQMSLNKDFFDDNGRGFGEMFGFHLCDGNDGTINIRERYLIGFQTASSTSPTNLTDTTTSSMSTNYGKLKNTGGLSSVTLKPENLPPHSHGGNTSVASNNLRHQHEIQWGHWQKPQPPQPGKFFARSKKLPAFQTHQNRLNYRKYFTLNTPFGFEGQSILLRNYAALKENGIWKHTPESTPGERQLTFDLEEHTHNTPNITGNVPHENNPPFCWVVHYEKINPYN